MTVECILCADEAEFIGVGECNHQPICYRCIYKMRVISKNNQCPICKTSLKIIIIAEQFRPFQTFKNNVIPDKNFADVFHQSERARDSFEKLTEYKCFVKIQGKPCKFDKKFPSVAFLKKHLKEDHNRYICEICVEKKTCVLEQQKLYTFKTLSRHQQRGDLDQFGNVTFLHPYCTFCSKYFFDEDEFRVHINLQHMICHVCSKQHRYRYYKNYDGLEIHYKMSHYICSDQNCLAKKFIAFKNAEQLKVHRLQVHDRFNKKIDIKEMCGFQYEGHNQDDQIIVIKDKQGVDMEDQFLNLKKCKNKALGEADQQYDSQLDVRIFYQCQIDEEQHFEDAFILKHKSTDDRPQTQGQKKKKFVQKTQLQKQKPLIAKQNQNFNLQDLSLIQTINLPKLSYQQFENKLKNVLGNEDIARFNTSRVKMNKKQIKINEFMDQFLKIMKNVSLKGAYLILPHFTRTVVSEDLKNQLDLQFGKMLKQLPTKYENIFKKCQLYSDLFKSFLKQIQQNIEYRIRNKSLNIKKPVKRTKQRLFQIMGVVRRLKIEQMAKFKFATNFGLHKDTIQHILKIFKKDIKDIQVKLDKIQTDQLLDLYVFVKFCFQAIKHSKNMQIQKNKIHQNIIEDFLFERPELEKQFGLRKEDLKNLDEEVQFQNLQEEKKAKQTLKQIQKKNEKKGYHAQTDYNLVDKGDFPDLVMPKKQQSKRQQKFKQVIQNVKEKPATYQKKINEMFPTLSGGESNSPIKQQAKPQIKHEVQNEPAWWQKINEVKKPKFEQDGQDEKVRVRKGKKKQKWVSVKGVFN